MYWICNPTFYFPVQLNRRFAPAWAERVVHVRFLLLWWRHHLFHHHYLVRFAVPSRALSLLPSLVSTSACTCNCSASSAFSTWESTREKWCWKRIRWVKRQWRWWNRKRRVAKRIRSKHIFDVFSSKLQMNGHVTSWKKQILAWNDEERCCTTRSQIEKEEKSANNQDERRQGIVVRLKFKGQLLCHGIQRIIHDFQSITIKSEWQNVPHC